jgi:PHD/YefM family antitoxin component YafN of YafNO toxin-antitoxin module
MWIAEQIAVTAEGELDEERIVRRQLVETEIQFEAGLIDEDEYERIEDELLERLELSTGEGLR